MGKLAWQFGRRTGALSLLVGVALAAGATQAQAVTIKELSTGLTSYNYPNHIAAGPDGNLWFTGHLPASVDRITPAGVLTEFFLTPGSGLEGITAGPDGNVWFTETGRDRIGRLTPAGSLSEFFLDNSTSPPHDLAAGPDGNLWFTEWNGMIGRITPEGVVTKFSSGITPGSEPRDITAGPDGNLWFTEGDGMIGRITPEGVVTKFSSGITPGSEPRDITAGPDGNLWFTEGDGMIGRITPEGVVTEFSSGITPGSEPRDIAAGPDGNLWFTERAGSRIGRITPEGVVTEFSEGITPGSLPAGITAGPEDSLWFTEEDGQIGQVMVESAKPTYYVSTSGSDSNSGTLAAPWRTVSHAASTAGAGATVLIEGGSYPEDVTLGLSGAPGSPITFQANGSEAVTVRSFNLAASHVAIENLTISGASGPCVTIQPALSDVTIQGNQINDCGRDGIHFVRPGDPPSANYTTASAIVGNAISAVGRSDSEADDITIYANYLTVQGNDMTGTPNDVMDAWGDHLTIRQNNIHDIANTVGNHDDVFQTWTGLNDGSEGNPVTNLLFEQNRITNVLGSNAHGFMVEGPGHHDWTVRDNVFQNIGSTGMILGITGTGNSSQNLDVYNNTFYDAGPNDDVQFNSADTGLFADNILQGGGGLYVSRAATVTEDYNLLYETIEGGGAPHDITANPDFLDAALGDFQLALGSPAINAGDPGTIVNPPRPYDFAGNPGVVGGIVDMGAYEHQ